jgi:hypothetical protein
MSGQFDVHSVTVNISTLGAAGTVPVCFIPDFGGAITVLDAQITGTTAGTPVGLKLVRMSDANPPVIAGTIASWGGTFAAGTITMGAGSVFEATINTAAVQPGQWLAMQNTSGTTPAISFVTVSYVTGA